MSQADGIAPAAEPAIGERALLIGGEAVAATDRAPIDVVDPATEELIATVPDAGPAEVERAARIAHRAHEADVLRRLGRHERARILWRVADLIEEHGDELALLESRDNGMPVGDARYFHIPNAAQCFRYFAGWVDKIEGRASDIDERGHAMLGYTRREPVGAVGLIAPWNGPLLMSSWKLAPALAAGCPVVLKPAAEAPLSPLRLGELLLEAGLPPEALSVLPGGAQAGAALLERPEIAKVSFTGSTETGRAIVRAAAVNLTRLTLELGGKSPVVIFADADLDRAVEGAAAAIFANAGQVCTAGSRVYVEAPVYDQVIRALGEAARGWTVGHGRAADSRVSPLISARQRDRVAAMIQSGIDEGAELVTGGIGTRPRGFFVEPTVLGRTTGAMRVVREEIFGPVVSVASFTDADDAIAAANASPYGLAASVWTRDGARGHGVARRLQAGTVGINVHSVFDYAMPFGGFKASGWGREHGAEGLDGYLQSKSVFAAL